MVGVFLDPLPSGLMQLRRSTLNLVPLHTSVGSDNSSPEPSPSQLSDSGGKFRIGAFEIGRDGVTDLAAAAATSPPPSSSMDQPQSAPTLNKRESSSRPAGDDALHAGIDFKELQPLQIIGRGASGFVRRAEVRARHGAPYCPSPSSPSAPPLPGTALDEPAHPS